MDEHGPFVLLLLVFVISFLFVISVMYERLDETREELTTERAYGEQVLQYYGALIKANAELREQVLELSQNASMQGSILQACMARLPDEIGPLAPQRQRIDFSNLHISDDSVVIKVEDLIPGIIAPTGSMEPFLRAGTIVLETLPRGPSDVMPGDVIVFESGGTRIIHRVVRIGVDDSGWFAVTRGDNNIEADPYQVRYSQIRGIVVGIIY